jgi:hypothetical protein
LVDIDTVQKHLFKILGESLGMHNCWKISIAKLNDVHTNSHILQSSHVMGAEWSTDRCRWLDRKDKFWLINFHLALSNSLSKL